MIRSEHMPITLVDEDNGQFSIERNTDGTEVGFLETTGATIVQIDIYPDYRRNGYATEAVRQFIEYARTNTDYNYIRTTAIVSTGFQDLVTKEFGFKPTRDETANTYRKPIR